jgi:hypothetical protein
MASVRLADVLSSTESVTDERACVAWYVCNFTVRTANAGVH